MVGALLGSSRFDFTGLTSNQSTVENLLAMKKCSGFLSCIPTGGGSTPNLKPGHLTTYSPKPLTPTPSPQNFKDTK